MKRIALSALALAATTTTVHAEGWKFAITPYAWATNVGVDAKLGDRTLVDEDISVGDLLEDLDTIAQVRLDARKGSYGLSADLFDVNLSDAQAVALPNNAGTVNLSSDIGMTILDLAGTYDLTGGRQGLVFLAGSRIVDERAELEAVYGNAPARTVDTEEVMVDVLMGVRGNLRLSKHFFTQMRADFSTGGTEYTYSMSPALGYAFNDKLALTAGYRHMKVDFQDTKGFEPSMTMSGAIVGLRTAF